MDKKKLLTILAKNARISAAHLASALGATEKEVEATIAAFEKDGTICGYDAVIDWEKADMEVLKARIEVKVTPQKGQGFDEIARRIMAFDEVETLYLMSGNYDLAITVSGRSFKEVAMFVAQRLSPLEYVTSTSTSFVLKKYKDSGIRMCGEEKDERGLV